MRTPRTRRGREFAQLRAGGWTVVAVSPFRRRPIPLPAVPAPDPAAAPGGLVSVDCPVCGRSAGPFGRAEAERLAGTHDDLIHRGRPTAEIRPDTGPAPTWAGAA